MGFLLPFLIRRTQSEGRQKGYFKEVRQMAGLIPRLVTLLVEAGKHIPVLAGV